MRLRNAFAINKKNLPAGAFLKVFRCHFSTNEKSINDIYKYVLDFNGSKFEKYQDSLVVNNKIFGKLSSIDEVYQVYKSNLGWKVYKVFVSQLFMVILVLILSYNLLKSAKKEWMKKQLVKLAEIEGQIVLHSNTKLYIYSICLFFTILMLEILRRNNFYKVWKYIKVLEITKDLKMLKITTYTNKILFFPINDVYLYTNIATSRYSTENLKKVDDTLIVGVRDSVFVLPLETATIQSKDLLSLCLRGYKLFFRNEN